MYFPYEHLCMVSMCSFRYTHDAQTHKCTQAPETMVFQNDWTRSHFTHTVHCDNTKPVYIQNYVGVYLALGQERERGREGGGERGGERKTERGREFKRKRIKVFVKEIERNHKEREERGERREERGERERGERERGERREERGEREAGETTPLAG